MDVIIVIYLQVRDNIYPHPSTYTCGCQHNFLFVRKNIYDTETLSYHLKGLNTISQVLLAHLQYYHHLTGLTITHGCNNSYFSQVRGNIYPRPSTYTPVGVKIFFSLVKENIYGTETLSYHLQCRI